jgi:hypothetical protein
MVADIAFAASTGRTATTFLARTLDALPNVKAMHEGHALQDGKIPLLPLINIHNRKSWHDATYAHDIVEKMRSPQIMSDAAGDAALCIDVAFYNAPLVEHLSKQYPDSPILVLFRRCEGFVQSATIVNGEDREPAGWPDPEKALTPREQFISMGRLKPEKGTPEYLDWENWSGISRNIWLWSTVNTHLLNFAKTNPNCTILYYETLRDNPVEFWNRCLSALGLVTSSNLDTCLSKSGKKVNTRVGYDVGNSSSWGPIEQEMYRNLALPIEKQIYDR